MLPKAVMVRVKLNRASARNRVAVTIKVKEGKVSTIKDVNIVGAKVFDREDCWIFEMKYAELVVLSDINTLEKN